MTLEEVIAGGAAFSTAQVKAYCARRERSRRIDDPGLRIEFVFAATLGRHGVEPGGRLTYDVHGVPEGNVGVIQATPSAAPSVTVFRFRCAYTAMPDKCYWIPLDPAAYGEFAYAGFDPV